MVEKNSDRITEEHLSISRGIFSESDRKFLAWNQATWAEKYDISNPAQSAYVRREAIKERLGAALWDLSSANHSPHSEFLEEVIAEGYTEYESHIPYQMFVRSIGFLLRSIMNRETDRLDDEDFLSKAIEDSVAEMLRGSNRRMGTTGYKNLDVNVKIDGWVPLDKAEWGVDLEELEDQQLRWLLRMGEISDEEFARAVLSDELEDEN